MQPDPTPGTGDVWLDVVDAVEMPDPLRFACLARRRLGVERYGTPLQYGNGRDPDADLLDELLDGAVYAWQGGRQEMARDLLAMAGQMLGCSLEDRPALMRSAIVAALVSAGMDEAAAVAARVEVIHAR